MKDEPFESEQNETEENKPLLEVNQRFIDPLDQGNLLRDIDNCSVVARSVVQAQLKAPDITVSVTIVFFISTQKHKRGNQKSCPW